MKSDVELSIHEKKLVVYLDRSHRDGELELDIKQVASVLDLPVRELAVIAEDLRKRGFLDRMDSPSSLSLSVKGMAAAREQTRDETEQDKFVASKIQGETAILTQADIIVRLHQIAANWSSAVGESNLTTEEKAVVREIGGRFFAHPATLELLRRHLTTSKM